MGTTKDTGAAAKVAFLVFFELGRMLNVSSEVCGSGWKERYTIFARPRVVMIYRA